MLAAANELVWMDGLNTIKMKNSYEEGYDLMVCIKLEFTANPVSSYQGVSTTEDVTTDYGKVVYTLTQDTVIF